MDNSLYCNNFFTGYTVSSYNVLNNSSHNITYKSIKNLFLNVPLHSFVESNMNIVFFVSSLNSGGIENYLLRFLKEKSDNFESIYIYCKSGSSGQLETEYTKIENVTIVKRKIGIASYKDLFFLRSFIVNNQISSVCDFTGNFSGLTLMVAYSAKVPKRVAFYRASSNRFKSDVLRNTYNAMTKRLVTRYATDILSNSQAGLDFFFTNKWQSDQRFEIIKNGVNADVFLRETADLRQKFGIPSAAFVIGHTGRYNSAKNHETVLAVAEIMVNKYDDIYFILCGNGVKDILQDTLKTKKLDSRVLVFENRDDIPKFLNTMDCYFFPSVTEGQPNALIEAMITGLPYVASDIAPIKETVLNLNNLYGPKDIEAFVKALETIYKEKSPRDIHHQQQIIDKFDADKCFSSFYKRLST